MRGKKKGKKKNGEKSGNWVGKHKILVKARGPSRLEYFVVDLNKMIVEMKHPYKLYGRGFILTSTTVFLGDKILVYEIGSCMEVEDKFNPVVKESIDDHIHTPSGTSKSILNLKTDPPEWSKWKDCGAQTTTFTMFSVTVTLGNKIFAFGGIHSGPLGQVYDIDGAKWEDLTNPSGLDREFCYIWTQACHSVLSDPQNNRLILHFLDARCLYAYYPNKEEESQWECLDTNIEKFPGLTAQVLDDVIYFFEPPYTILAYYVPQRKWLNVSWHGKKLQDCDMFFDEMAKIIHLGDGIMCLAISHNVPIPPHKSLQFFRFRVRRVADEDVGITPLSFHSFEPDQGCHPFSFTPF